MLTTKQRDEYASLRIEVYVKIDSYLGVGKFYPFSLAWLLEYKNYKGMKDNFNDKDASICRALSGPHGYTIYKMLLAKRSPPQNL